MNSVLDPITAKAGERGNWDALAALRFFLALIVAVTHLAEYTPRLGAWHWIADLGSFEAILGFLLISGYSIGHSLQKEPKGFLRRRMLRIYPVYLAAMALTYFTQRDPLTVSVAATLFLNLLFLSQVLFRWSYVGASWSLSLEVWLYCLAPFLIRLRARALETLMAASFFCYAVYSCGCALFHLPYFAGTLFGINLPCLAFIWIAGLYLSTAREKARPLKIIGWIFLGHLLLVMLIQIFHRFKHHDLRDFLFLDATGYALNGALLALIYLIFAGILSHRFHLPTPARRVFRFLGDISYPLYLVHMPAFILLAPRTQNAGLLLLGAVALSTAVYVCCDFYSRRRKLG